MADKWKVLEDFWSRFDLPAYDENTVPDNAELPRITYEAATGSMDDVLALSGSLWYKDDSWQAISLKAIQIQDAIGSGLLYTVDGGYVWIHKGNPFARRMADDSEDYIRRIIINITAEYLTA